MLVKICYNNPVFRGGTKTMTENPIVIKYNGKQYSRAETIIALKLYDDLKSGKLAADIMEAVKNEF